MKKLKDYDGYQITDTNWGYYITLGSTKYNQMRTYEYDVACGTREEVEDFLKKHTFKEIVKAFREQFVYLECVEEIY